MILLDVNLLVYAKMDAMQLHDPAHRWLDKQLNEVGGVAIPWASLLGFVRIVTNPRIFENPMSVGDAWEQVRDWRSLPSVYAPEPAERYPEILRELMREVGRSEQIPDAHLAALAIENGLTLCSTDRDFARFSGLKWQNPIEG